MVVAVFRSRRSNGSEDEYRSLALRMLDLARSMPGFLSFKSFASEDGESVSLIEFESMECLEAWREHPEHRGAQQAGRERIYSEYRLQVCEPVRAAAFDGVNRRQEMETSSN